MSKSCRFWTSSELRVSSSAPITRKSLCFDFGRTDRLYVFYEFDSCPKILESVRALQRRELGTPAARERHCPAILQSSVPRQYLAVGAALPLSVSCYPVLNLIDRYFQLECNRTTLGRDVAASLTTFVTISAIVVVNPAILK